MNNQICNQARSGIYVAAYGSNLYEPRMKSRCPSATIIGTSTLNQYRLLFKKSLTGAYATIEQDANCYVPVVVYQINAEDEKNLDRFEGCPRIYYKKYFPLQVKRENGKWHREVVCSVYIMHEYRILAKPSEEYFWFLDTGYLRWGFDPVCLYKALDDSIGKNEAPNWLKNYFEKERVS